MRVVQEAISSTEGGLGRSMKRELMKNCTQQASRQKDVSRSRETEQQEKNQETATAGVSVKQRHTVGSITHQKSALGLETAGLHVESGNGQDVVQRLKHVLAARVGEQLQKRKRMVRTYGSRDAYITTGERVRPMRKQRLLTALKRLLAYLLSQKKPARRKRHKPCQYIHQYLQTHQPGPHHS